MANADPIFSTATWGSTFIDATSKADHLFNSILQPDGKLLIVSYSSPPATSTITRLNADGTLDLAFGTNGHVTILPGGVGGILGLALDADGRILFTGKGQQAGVSSHEILTGRLNADGSLDTTFGNEGKTFIKPSTQTYNAGYSIAEQPDGKIVVVGNLQSMDHPGVVLRYTAGGELDTTFNANGIHLLPAGVGLNHFAIQNDGKIVVVGEGNSTNTSTSFALVYRINTDGTLDTTFGDSNGRFSLPDWTNTEFHQPVMLNDGSIVVAGYKGSSSSGEAIVVKLTPSGELDTSFGTAGMFTRAGAAVSTIAKQGDDFIIVGRESGVGNNYLVMRLTQDGELDETFGVDGFVRLSPGNSPRDPNVHVEPDGQIVIAGSNMSGTAIVSVFRLDPNGNLDRDFNFQAGSDTLDGMATFTPGGDAAVLDSSVSIYSAELAARGHYQGATLELARAGGPQTQDIFGGSDNLVLNGTQVVLGAAVIATMSQVDGKLTMTFTALATQARLNEALGKLTYRLDDTPSAGTSLQIEWTFKNPPEFGTQPAVGTTTVNIDVPNVAPTDIILSNHSISEAADTSESLVIGTLTATDADTEDVHTFSIVPGRDAIYFEIVDGALHLKAGTTLDHASTPTLSVTIRVTDAAQATYDEVFTIDIDRHDPLPTLEATPANPNFTEGELPTRLFSDVSADIDADFQTISRVSLSVTGVADGADEQLIVFGQAIALVHGSGVLEGIGSYTVMMDGDFAKVTLHGMTLNGDSLDSLVNGLSYRHVSDTPTPGAREIRLNQIEDSGEDVLEPDLTSTVTVTAVNDVPTFAAPTGGTARIDLNGGNDIVNASVLQDDGKLIVAGQIIVGSGGSARPEFTVARFLADGTLDPSFGVDGMVLKLLGNQFSEAHGVHLQPDGSVLVSGFTRAPGEQQFVVVRLDASGALDESFGEGGIARTKIAVTIGTQLQATDMVVLDDGSIVISGSSGASGGATAKAHVVRLDADGKIDPENAATWYWTNTGSFVSAATVLQDNGQLLIGGRDTTNGWYPAVHRLNADGTADLSFGNAGRYFDLQSAGGRLTALLEQADGKIVLVTAFYANNANQVGTVRLNADGSLDNTFGANGRTDLALPGNVSAEDIVQQADGKLVLVGTADNDVLVIRLNADGTLDQSFGDKGQVRVKVSDEGADVASTVHLTDAGKIVITAHSDRDIALIRLNADGSLDDSFNRVAGQDSLGGEVSYDHTQADLAIVLDSDVRVFDAELSAQGHYQGASVTLSRQDGANADDHFGATGALVLEDGDAVLNDVVIGTFASGSGWLTLTFNEFATQARVNQALSSLTYRFDGETPPGSIVIDWTISDGNTGSQGPGGAQAGVGSTTIYMNAPPTGITLSSDEVAENTDTASPLTIGTLGTTDADADDTFTYEIVGGADKDVFELNGDALQFKAGTVLDYETKTSYAVTIRTTDSRGETFERELTIQVQDVNEAPELVTALANQAFASGEAFTFTLPADSFVDPDANDSITYSATRDDGEALPTWLTFDASSRTFTGNPPEGLTVTFTVRVTATDTGLEATHADFNVVLDVAPVIVDIERNPSIGDVTAADSLQFLVRFADAVEGLSADAFSLYTDGNVTGTISNVIDVGHGSEYAVTVTNIAGDGVLRLDVKATGTGITSESGVPLAGGFTTGQSYTLDNTQPVVSSITPPADGLYGIGDTLDFTVTLSEAITLDTQDGDPTLEFLLGTGLVDIVPFGRGPITITPTPTVAATFVSIGTDGTTLVFRLTVKEGWSPDDLLSVNQIQLNGARITDAAGNPLDLFPAQVTLYENITLDGIAPDAPQIDSAELTKLEAPVIHGTAEAGSTVTVSVGGATYTVTATNGTWTLDLDAVEPDMDSPPLSLNPNGQNMVSVVATDAAGNASEPATQTLVIDTTRPGVPTDVTLPQGITNKDEVTVDGLEPNATWQYSLNGGETWLDGEGDHFLLDEGDYEPGDIQVRQIDEAGNLGEVLASTQAVTIDTTKPADPIVGSATLTNQTTPVVSGTAEPGATVMIIAGGALYSLTADAEDGSWTVTIGVTEPLNNTPNLNLNGVNDIIVAVMDAAGNDSGTVTHKLTIDTTPPGLIEASLPTAAFTKQDTVTVDLTTLEAGATWQYSLDGGENWTDGEDDSFELEEVSYDASQIRIRQVDAAGNAGEAIVNQGSVTVDITPPNAPTFTSAALTNVDAPVISGAVEAGSVVWVAVAGVSYRILDTSDGTWTLDLATAEPWYDTETLNLNLNGDNIVNVTATDPAGNVSSPGSQTLTIDTTPPAVPTGVTLPAGGPTNVDEVTIDLDALEDGATWQYSLDGGEHWTDGDDTGRFALDEQDYPEGAIQVRQVDQAGNIGDPISNTDFVTVDVTEPETPTITSVELSNAQYPVITGTGEIGSGAIVKVGDAVYTIGIIDGTWTLDLATASPDDGSPALLLNRNGDNPIHVTVQDPAGNVSEAAEQTLVIDTTAPNAPIGVTLPEGGPTNVDQVTVDLQALEDGATWQYSVDGGENWHDGDDAGTFHLEDATYEAGAIQVRQIDKAGNEGSVVKTTAEVIIDTVRPEAPSIDSADLSNSTTPVLSGTAEVGSTVTVYVVDAIYTVLAADGTWTLDLAKTAPDAGSPALVLNANGSNAIVVETTDAAGNVSDTDTQSLVIDTNAPQAPTGVTLPDGGPTNVNTVTVDLQALEPGATWQYSLDGGDNWIDGDETGSFSLEDATYAAGDIQVRQTDAAGNEGVALKTMAEVIVDTVKPEAPTFSTGKLTNSPTPVLSGLAEAGSAVTVSIGGTVFTVIATNGTWTLDLGTAQPDDGAPDLALNVNGSNHVIIVATDAAGNASEIGQQNLSIDTDAPDAPTGVELPAGPTNVTDIVIDLDALEKNATWQYSTDGGDTWNNGEGDRFTLDEGVYAAGDIQVRQIDAAGNEGAVLKTPAEVTVDTTPPEDPTVTSSALTNQALPVIRGSAEAGSLVVIATGGAEYEVYADADGKWVLDLSQATPDSGTLALDANGDNTVWVESADPAGNWSEQISFTLTIDTTRPFAPKPTDVTLPPGNPTNVNEIVLDLEALEDGATWQYTVDGETWIDGEADRFSLEDGTYAPGSIRVRQVDAAGNEGYDISLALTLVVDTVAPEAPTFGSATLTSSPMPVLSGRAEDGSTVTVLVGGATYTTVAQNGAWQVSLASAQPVEGTLALNLNGANAITVTSRDAAGNLSEARTQTVTIDTTPPAPLTLSFTAGATNWVIGVTNHEAGATWQYQLNGGEWVTGQGNSFTVPMGAYPAGSILVRQVDAAGNISTLAGNAALARPDNDGDGLDDGIENGVPGMEGGQQGDGNGDGIPDIEQHDVTSLPWIQTPDGQVRYVTLVNDAGLVQQAVSTAPIDADSVPQGLTLPLGALAFTVRDLPESGIVTFSVFVDADVPVNGYWKQVDGVWINIATAITAVGGKIRIDFQIEDGGPLDADGVRNGVIVDPGAPGWFDGNPLDVDGDQVPDLLEWGLGLTPGVKDNDVFARDDLFVMQVYRDAFGREADAGGLGYWVDQLGDGLARDAFLTSVWASDEARATEPLVQLTVGLFERAPEAGEWTAWRDGLADGQTAVALADAFVLAQYDQAGDAAFIDQLYADALSRDADAAGRDYWVQALADGSSRGEVALQFVQTDEALQLQGRDLDVTLLYTGLLGRGADTEGLAYWGEALANGASLSEVAIAIVGSAEYHDRFLPAEGNSDIQPG